MNDFTNDPREDFLNHFKLSKKKWHRFAWGITLSDRSISFNYWDLERVLTPTLGYKSNSVEYAFIPDFDIFEEDAAYEDFLIFNAL